MTVDVVQQARKIADAVLYEGYVLYPYRATAAKNQVRWQYGIVGPAGGVEAGVGEESTLHTECLLELEGDSTSVDVHLRFLQVQARIIERVVAGSADEFTAVAELTVGAETWVTWDEAVEHEIEIDDVAVADFVQGRRIPVEIDGGEDVEQLRDGETLVGRVVRRRWPLRGELALSGTQSDAPRPLVRLRIELSNVTPYDDAAAAPSGSRRDGAVRQSFVGTHFLLHTRGGGFVSLIDPPGWAATEAARCTNRRCWPILVGEKPGRDLVLASPIILYDHPEIAPESPGDLYDATEIDEILTLRIMTMTDEEKAAARATDPRARAIIDRSDLMPPEVFERLHGALRGFEVPLRDDAVELAVTNAEPSADAALPTPPAGIADDGIPWWGEEADASVSPETDTVQIGSVTVAKGTRVRIRPKRRADAHDLFLSDKTAVVSRVYSDVDGNTHVAVTLEDDPASEFHDWYGRYYYFAPDELEPLRARSSPQSEGRP